MHTFSHQHKKVGKNVITCKGTKIKQGSKVFIPRRLDFVLDEAMPGIY